MRVGASTPRNGPRWSRPAIQGILRSPTYTGQGYARRTRYRIATHWRSATHPFGRTHGTAVPQLAKGWLLVGQVPAMMSQEHFDEVQAKLATNQSFARGNNTAHQYLLRALVSCGHACTARAISGRDFYYLCNGKGHTTFSHRASRCPARYTPADQLDILVWQNLCALLAEPEPEPLAAAVARAHGGAWLPQELFARRGQAHLRQQVERLTSTYSKAVLPLDKYERRRRDLEQRVQALADQEEQLRRSDAARQQQFAGIAASLKIICARVQGGLVKAGFEQLGQLVLLLIDRVVITDAEVKILYVLPSNPASEHVRFCHLCKDYFHNSAPRQQHGGTFGLKQLDHLEADTVSGRGSRELRVGIARVNVGGLDTFASETPCTYWTNRWAASWSDASAADMCSVSKTPEHTDREVDLAAPFALGIITADFDAAFGSRTQGAAVQHGHRILQRASAYHLQHRAQVLRKSVEQPARNRRIAAYTRYGIVAGYL